MVKLTNLVIVSSQSREFLFDLPTCPPKSNVARIVLFKSSFIYQEVEKVAWISSDYFESLLLPQ